MGIGDGDGGARNRPPARRDWDVVGTGHGERALHCHSGAAVSALSDFTVTSITGEPMPLSTLAGGVTLVVNVASQCGLTPQYAGLEALYRSYHAQGLTVLGCPCNQFGGQEPGTEDTIVQFCSTHYDVTFPLTAKLNVNGADAHPPVS